MKSKSEIESMHNIAIDTYNNINTDAELSAIERFQIKVYWLGVINGLRLALGMKTYGLKGGLHG